MKKRILSIALCLMLALGLLPFPALAADIPSVYVSGVDHPVAGQALDGAYNVPSAVSYAKDEDFAEIVWYDLGKNASFPGKLTYAGPEETPLASGAVAEAGHSYIAALHLKRTGSDMFPQKSFSVNTSDEMKKRLWSTAGCSKELSMSAYAGVVFLYYKCDAAYDQWNSLYLDVARDFRGYVEAGQSIWQAEEFSGLYAKNAFDLTAVWKDGSSTMTPGEKFIAGRTYTLTLTLSSPKFSNNTSFLEPFYVDLANGAAWAEAKVESKYRATVTFSIPCKARVSELDIEGIKNPVAGEVMQTGGFTLSPEGAEIKSAAWYQVTGSDTLTPAEGSFAPNSRYRLQLTLGAAEGYFLLLSKSAVGANAGAVSTFQAYLDGDVEVGIDFTLGDVPNAPVAGTAVDVNAPKAGELPSYVATVNGTGCNVFADDDGSYIGGVCWLDVTEDPKLSDDDRVLKDHKYDPFLGGHTYQVIIELTAQEGYVFADAPVATLNGQPTPETYLQGEVLRVVYTFQPLPVELTGIAVTAPPAKTSYAAGEVFDETGMTVTATYSDGSSKTVADFGTSPTGALLAGDTEITVFYTEDNVTYTATTPITVKAAEKSLKSIEITAPPAKTEYQESETFEPYGMVVTATYSDGSSKTVTDFDISPSGSLIKGETEITVFYTENGVTFSATTPVTVKAGSEITSVAVTVAAPKAGEQANLAATAAFDARYTVQSVSIFCDEDNVQLKNGDVYGKKTYILNVTLAAAEGCHFAGEDLLHGKLNGEAAQVRPLEDGSALLTKIFPLGNVNPFEDVAESDYFYDAVLWAYYAEPQVTNGIDATHFGPTSTVTRGQAVTFLWRAMGCPEPETEANPFEDVKDSNYFYKPVLWAVEQGITNGTDATHFTPAQTCSTAHILTFLYRALGIGTNGWYEVAEAWAKGAGLLEGLDVTVAPGVDCPRCDVVLFLFRQLA